LNFISSNIYATAGTRNGIISDNEGKYIFVFASLNPSKIQQYDTATLSFINEQSSSANWGSNAVSLKNLQFNPTGGPGDVPAVDPAAVVTVPETVPVTVPATEPEPAEPQPVVCASKYTVQLGDSWYGIADAAGVKAGLLAGVNNTTLQSNLLVGEEICLPPGAATPPVKTVAKKTAQQEASQ
jgi:LysM repeat protein